MKTRYWIIFAIAGIMIIVMSAYHYWTRPGKGDVAPQFALPDIAGREILLADYQGRVVFLNFWATWCHTCRAELPVIEQINRKFGKSGLAVISILVDEKYPQNSIQEIKRYIPFTFPVLVDDNGNVADAYEVWGVPESFIIDRDGIILKRFSSAVTEEEVESYLNRFLTPL